MQFFCRGERLFARESFKATATVRANELRGTPGKSIWQRNYYEHVIRNDSTLTAKVNKW